MPDLKQDKENERNEEGDKGSGVDGDLKSRKGTDSDDMIFGGVFSWTYDILAVLLHVKPVIVSTKPTCPPWTGFHLQDKQTCANEGRISIGCDHAIIPHKTNSGYTTSELLLNIGKFRVGAGFASYTPSPMAPIAAMVIKSRI